MDIRVGDVIRSIPEAWIPRWRFLSDYREEIGIEVEWTYTDLATLDNWVRLNKSIDSVAERRKGTPAIPPMWPYDRDWQPLSTIWNIIEFMNPISDNYLSHVIIDKALLINRREEAYEKLGKTAEGEEWRPSEVISNVLEYLYMRRWYRGIPRDKPLLSSVRDRIIGIFFSSVQLANMKDPYRDMRCAGLRSEDIVNVDWERLSATNLPRLPNENGQMELVDHVKKCVVGSTLCKFMARQELPPHVPLPLVSPQNSIKTLLTVDSYENYSTYPFLIMLDKEATQKLIENVDYYVDNSPPERLTDVAKYLLGLGPILDSGEYLMGASNRKPHTRINAPAYYFIAVYNALYKGSSAKMPEKSFLDVCLYLGSKWGTFYLHSCVKCLLSLIEYRKSGYVAQWEDLITKSKKQINLKTAAKNENKRLIAFCEAAMVAIDRHEEKAGGMTTFSSPPVLGAGLIYM